MKLYGLAKEAIFHRSKNGQVSLCQIPDGIDSGMAFGA
jgi:hypothetical protein